MLATHTLKFQYYKFYSFYFKDNEITACQMTLLQNELQNLDMIQKVITRKKLEGKRRPPLLESMCFHGGGDDESIFQSLGSLYSFFGRTYAKPMFWPGNLKIEKWNNLQIAPSFYQDACFCTQTSCKDVQATWRGCELVILSTATMASRWPASAV